MEQFRAEYRKLSRKELDNEFDRLNLIKSQGASTPTVQLRTKALLEELDRRDKASKRNAKIMVAGGVLAGAYLLLKK